MYTFQDIQHLLWKKWGKGKTLFFNEPKNILYNFRFTLMPDILYAKIVKKYQCFSQCTLYKYNLNAGILMWYCFLFLNHVHLLCLFLLLLSWAMRRREAPSHKAKLFILPAAGVVYFFTMFVYPQNLLSPTIRDL